MMREAKFKANLKNFYYDQEQHTAVVELRIKLGDEAVKVAEALFKTFHPGENIVVTIHPQINEPDEEALLHGSV